MNFEHTCAELNNASRLCNRDRMRTFTSNAPCFEESRDSVDNDVFPRANSYHGDAYKDRADWLRWGLGPEDDGPAYESTTASLIDPFGSFTS